MTLQYDFGFRKTNYGCSDFYSCFRLSSDIDGTLKGFVKFRATIRIAR